MRVLHPTHPAFLKLYTPGPRQRRLRTNLHLVQSSENAGQWPGSNNWSGASFQINYGLTLILIVQKNEFISIKWASCASRSNKHCRHLGSNLKILTISLPERTRHTHLHLLGVTQIDLSALLMIWVGWEQARRHIPSTPTSSAGTVPSSLQLYTAMYTNCSRLPTRFSIVQCCAQVLV